MREAQQQLFTQVSIWPKSKPAKLQANTFLQNNTQPKFPPLTQPKIHLPKIHLYRTHNPNRFQPLHLIFLAASHTISQKSDNPFSLSTSTDNAPHPHHKLFPSQTLSNPITTIPIPEYISPTPSTANDSGENGRMQAPISDDCIKKQPNPSRSHSISRKNAQVKSKIGSKRKVGKGTSKIQKRRGESKKWPSFARGMSDEEELNDCTKEGKSELLVGESDRISKMIRDEAIKTWNFGKKIGLSNQKSEEEIVENLVSPERGDQERNNQAKEKNQDNSETKCTRLVELEGFSGRIIQDESGVSPYS